MLAIEYDGRHHIDRESQWRNDMTRREELESAGWRFMVITGADLHQHPEHVLRRITGAVQAAGGKPSRLKPQWRRYFKS